MELTALALGFLGSLHCAGMCSPLAMVAVRGGLLRNRVLYHGGRIVTYGIFGALVSSFGALLSFPDLQYALSIALGIMLLAAGIFGTAGIRVPFVTAGLARLTIWLKLRFSVYLQQRNAQAVFLMGILNGILPCGLVYIALSYCITLAGWRDGLLFMWLFGVGTLPALVGAPVLFTVVTKHLHLSLRRVTMVLFILSGSLLIMRGVVHHVPHATDVPGQSVSIPVCQ